MIKKKFKVQRKKPTREKTSLGGCSIELRFFARPKGDPMLAIISPEGEDMILMGARAVMEGRASWATGCRVGMKILAKGMEQ